MKLEIVLVNVNKLPHGLAHRVTGNSGKIYATAHYNAAYGGHTAKIPYDEWKGGAGMDIVNGYHRAMSKWMVLVEATLDPDEATQRENELAAMLEEVTKERDEAQTHLAGATNVASTEFSESEISATTEETVPVPVDEFKGLGFRQIRAIAKQEGVANFGDITTSAALIAAILDHRKA